MMPGPTWSVSLPRCIPLCIMLHQGDAHRPPHQTMSAVEGMLHDNSKTQHKQNLTPSAQETTPIRCVNLPIPLCSNNPTFLFGKPQRAMRQCYDPPAACSETSVFSIIPRGQAVLVEEWHHRLGASFAEDPHLHVMPHVVNSCTFSNFVEERLERMSELTIQRPFR